MIEALRSASTVYLDSAPVIYFIEENKTFIRLVEPIIQAIASGEKEGFSSHLTLLEVLIKPLQKKRPDLAERYRDILLRSPHLRLLEVDSQVAEEAARISAQYGIRTPDCIHLASARLAGADVFSYKRQAASRVQGTQGPRSEKRNEFPVTP